MVWIIQPMERKDPETKQGSGKWDLVARSDEGGGFWPALPYPDHPGFDSPEEAAADPEARAIANQTAGIPDITPFKIYGMGVLEEKNTLDAKISKLERFLATPELHEISTTSIDLLAEQLTIMRSYSEILGKQIEAFPHG